MKMILDWQNLQARLATPGVFGSVAIVFFAVFLYSFSELLGSDRKLPPLPIALEKEVPNEKERIERYLSDTRELLINGYRTFKDQLFGISTTEGTSIVLPLKYLDDLKGNKNLTFSAFLETQFTLKEFTKLGNLTEGEIVVLNKELNPVLPEYVPVIHDLICKYFPFGECESLTTVKPYEQINRLVSRICARIFLGSDAASSDHWLNVASVYIKSAEHWISNLKKWPRPIRHVIWRWVEGRNDMMSKFEEGRKIVEKSLRQKRANGNKPLNNPPSLMDFLSSGKRAAMVDDTEGQTIIQMNLCVAAIQAQSATVMQCLIDISGYPEYIPELREEVEQALASTGGKWNKQALNQMLKLDSFLKETQRLNSPDLTSYQRRVLAPLTLSNGVRIPTGATLLIPTGAINMDSDFFELPEKFEGFRFYKKRQQSENDAMKHQLVTVGKTDLAWGYGRHACPGRFVADVVMKLLVIEFLMRYDIKFNASTTRPDNIIYEGILAPDPEWELSFIKRNQ